MSLLSGRVSFLKMDGAGNDFVGIDGRGRELPTVEELRLIVPLLCDRYHGIGADGMIIVHDAPATSDANFAMKYINADGSVGEMCGNGARCACVLAHHLGAAPAAMAFHTDAGLYRGEIVDGGSRVAFPPVYALPQSRTLLGTARPLQSVLFLTVGVPHAVVFTEDLDMIDVVSAGRAMRHDPAFAPAGTNANFAEFRDSRLHLRTYERGVEVETQACGTGSVATACCWAWQNGHRGPQQWTVVPTGGIPLEIAFDATERGFQQITLAGAARIVYTGEIVMA